MKKKKYLALVFNVVYLTIYAILNTFIAILHTLTIDLFKNIKLYIIMAINKEERHKIRKRLSFEKNQELIESRLQVVERLVYAVYNDPSYAKRKEGKYDLKELNKWVKK